jgi:hypothetical protein
MCLSPRRSEIKAVRILLAEGSYESRLRSLNFFLHPHGVVELFLVLFKHIQRLAETSTNQLERL